MTSQRGYQALSPDPEENGVGNTKPLALWCEIGCFGSLINRWELNSTPKSSYGEPQ